MVSTTHLCFLPAYTLFSEGKLTWEEYLHHALLHYVNLTPKHADDVPHRTEFPELLDKDPFGYALWSWQRESNGVNDVAQLEEVFRAYAQGSVDDFARKLDGLPWITAGSIRRSLTLLALRERKLDKLRFLLRDSQATYDPSPTRMFTDMALSVDKTREPELYDIIQQSEWIRLQARRNAHPPGKGKGLGGAPDGVEKYFNYW